MTTLQVYLMLGLVTWRTAFAWRFALGTVCCGNAGKTVVFIKRDKVLGFNKFIEKKTVKVEIVRRICMKFHVVIVIVSCVNTHKLSMRWRITFLRNKILNDYIEIMSSEFK